MRLTSVFRVLAASTLVAVPLRLDAQASLLPDTWYTFSGCWPGVSCHTVEVAVGHVVGDPLYSQVAPGAPLKAMIFRITSQYEAGATARDGVNYLVGTASGTYQTAGSVGADFAIPTACGTGGVLPTQARTCTDPTGFGPFTFGSAAPIGVAQGIVARVSLDWSPSTFQVTVLRGAPGTAWSIASGGEQQTLVLPLVATTSVVPEPGTLALLSGGLALFAGAARIRRRG